MLVPAIIDSVKLPLEFRRKQTAELLDWNGDPSHSGFQALCEGVANTIGNAPLHQLVRQGRKLQWSLRWAMAVIATIAIGRAWRPLASVMAEFASNADCSERSPRDQHAVREYDATWCRR